MGGLNVVQRVLLTACQIAGAMLAVVITVGCVGSLVAWVMFLLKYLLEAICWIWDKTFPPSERSRRYE